MSHRRLNVLADTGYVVLGDYSGPPIPREEWERARYLDWKSGGDTRWAPLASAGGELECGGFWAHGKPDKDGIWTSNRDLCPTLARWVEGVGARFGRVRIIRLNPSARSAAIQQLHRDDNNRLNPDGEPWIVRAWLELDAPPGCSFILRRDRWDPATETAIALHPGRQLLVDSERLYHAVHNPGPGPRYALIASFESSAELEAWCARGGAPRLGLQTVAGDVPARGDGRGRPPVPL